MPETSSSTTAAPATKRERDPAAAKQALIAAAVAEFASKGFAGARVDVIASEAGVNKQLVYHYFDSKQGLYLVALESVYAEIREKEQKLTLGALEPLEAMSQLVAFSFDYLAEHPEFIALLADENRNHGSHLRESERLQKMHSPFIEMLEATLERGVAAGVFRPDFDAINLYISIAGISYFFFSNNHAVGHLRQGAGLARRAAQAPAARHRIRAERPATLTPEKYQPVG